MSTDYFTWAFPSPDCEAGRSPPLAEVWTRFERPDAMDHMLLTVSRNMWLTATLARVTSHFGIRSLYFLSGPDDFVQEDSSHHKWIAVMLDRAAVIEAIAGVEHLLHCAAGKPGDFGALMSDTLYRCSEEEIREALASSSSIAVPQRAGGGQPSGEEEGNGLVYLFSFLKCLRSLLVHAQARGLGLIHLRYMH
jgi:hypothetical protein